METSITQGNFQRTKYLYVREIMDGIDTDNDNVSSNKNSNLAKQNSGSNF